MPTYRQVCISSSPAASQKAYTPIRSVGRVLTSCRVNGRKPLQRLYFRANRVTASSSQNSVAARTLHPHQYVRPRCRPRVERDRIRGIVSAVEVVVQDSRKSLNGVHASVNIRQVAGNVGSSLNSLSILATEGICHSYTAFPSGPADWKRTVPGKLVHTKQFRSIAARGHHAIKRGGIFGDILRLRQYL